MPHRKGDGQPHGWRRWAEYVARHPLPAAIVALVILVVLALPALDLYLGQQDNGAMPESTDVRRASDGLTAGFGAGTNGPLLISVDMSEKPAKADQSNLNKLSTDEQNQKDKANQAGRRAGVQQLEEEGMPPDAQAEAQVQPQLDKQIDSRSSSSRRRSASSSSSSATDPRLQDLRDDLKKASGVQKVSQPLVNKDGTAAVLNLTPTTAPSDKATAELVDAAARRHDPEGHAGQGHDRRTSAARRPATSTWRTRSAAG